MRSQKSSSFMSWQQFFILLDLSTLSPRLIILGMRAVQTNQEGAKEHMLYNLNNYGQTIEKKNW